MTLHLALPKGRMFDGIQQLLADAGVRLAMDPRRYRPVVSLDDVDTKLLKPRDVVTLLDQGSRDVGFAGADWVAELGADVVPLLDTGLAPVRLVLAAPPGVDLDRPGLRIATEYVSIAERWAAEAGLDARIVPTTGATEVYPPEDADCIVDNTATGSTLVANGLQIRQVLMTSATGLYASRRAMDGPNRGRIEELALVLQAALAARQRVLLEVNVDRERLDAVVEALPCMRRPTVCSLWGDEGLAVKAAVPRDALPTLLPELKRRGATDLVVSELAQVLP
jgi:ATP phosphoribosyltransferase